MYVVLIKKLTRVVVHTHDVTLTLPDLLFSKPTILNKALSND